MDARVFFKLCEMLEALGGLRATRHMLIDEQVAMFLHILAHHVKNRVIKHKFRISSGTGSRSIESIPLPASSFSKEARANPFNII